MLIYFEKEQTGKGQTERERECLKQGSETDTGLKLMNHEIMTQAKIKSGEFNRLSHPGAPLFHRLNYL